MIVRFFLFVLFFYGCQSNNGNIKKLAKSNNKEDIIKGRKVVCQFNADSLVYKSYPKTPTVFLNRYVYRNDSIFQVYSTYKAHLVERHFPKEVIDSKMNQFIHYSEKNSEFYTLDTISQNDSCNLFIVLHHDFAIKNSIYALCINRKGILIYTIEIASKNNGVDGSYIKKSMLYDGNIIKIIDRSICCLDMLDEWGNSLSKEEVSIKYYRLDCKSATLINKSE